ncbi:MAG: hypothetical protein RQM92_00440 [Candidatus Syntrophopropionicum ammoniitolerans]
MLGQQITVKAARTLAGRVAGIYGQALSTPIDGLTHTFPTPAHIAGLEGLRRSSGAPRCYRRQSPLH